MRSRFSSTASLLRNVTVMALLATLCAPGCSDDASGVPALLPISAQSVAVNQTLRIDLAVSNPDGLTLTFTSESPDLPGLDAVTELAGTPSGGTFRWTPLASHVGQHEFTFIATSELGESRQAVVITVTSPSDAAPIFLRPGAGGTYDLSQDPCVNFDIEVRDDDSGQVAIRAGEAPPAGAVIASVGNKRSSFEWCPSSDQIEAAERWTILLEADDFDHAPTQHSYVIVLRTPPKEDCEGEAPTIEILSPPKGEIVRSSTGYEVTIRVTDDMGLRDSPLLLYTTVEPEDPNKPDLRQFEQVEFNEDGSDWVARIPSLGLEVDQEQIVYAVATATDNDDSEGRSCDHTTDTDLHTFVAVGGEATVGTLGTCDQCDQSVDCRSGICATSAAGSRCLEPCSESACSVGSCMAVTDAAGSEAQACGDIAAVCEGEEACDDDGNEENDTSATATPFVGPTMDGQICPDNSDYYNLTVDPNTELEARLHGFAHADGDLDLVLYNADRQILGVGASADDEERVSYLSTEGGLITIRVLGFEGSQNPYSLTVTETEVSVCVDDGSEEDDTFDTAADFDESGFHSGTICSDDDDYLAFLVDGPTRIEFSMTFEWLEYDLDVDLLDEEGTVIAYSRRGSGEETIDHTVGEEGIYTLRIYGYLGDSGDYEAELVLSSSESCESDLNCPIGSICQDSTCVDADCSAANPCPTGYLCPLENPGTTTATCGSDCSVNSDCRDDEACKRFVERRACGETGSGQNGDACASSKDCGGQRTCADFENGYCARANCDSNSDCESDTACVAFGDVNYCMKDCLADSNVCRHDEGYDCEFATDVDGGETFICMESTD